MTTGAALRDAGIDQVLDNATASTADIDGNGTFGDLRVSASAVMTNGVTIDASALTGTNRLANGHNGIDILNAVSNTIGGPVASARNVTRVVETVGDSLPQRRGIPSGRWCARGNPAMSRTGS